MGDFNLDVDMELRPDYSYKIPLSHLTEFANITVVKIVILTAASCSQILILLLNTAKASDINKSILTFSINTLYQNLAVWIWPCGQYFGAMVKIQFLTLDSEFLPRPVTCTSPQ